MRLKASSAGGINEKWVLCIPLVQSRCSFGFLEIWSDDRDAFPIPLCRGEILIVDKFLPTKKKFFNREFATAVTNESVEKYRKIYLVTAHLFSDFDDFRREDGTLRAETNSRIGASKSRNFYPSGKVMDRLNQLESFYKSEIVPKRLRLLKELDSHTGVISLSQLHNRFELEEQTFCDVRPCLLTRKVLWNEFLVLELFDGSLKSGKMDGLDEFKAGSDPEMNGKSEIRHYCAHVPVFFVLIPTMFSSIYFTIPKLSCGKVLHLRHVLAFCYGRGKRFPYVCPRDTTAKAGFQGIGQIPSSHRLAKLLLTQYYTLAKRLSTDKTLKKLSGP